MNTICEEGGGAMAYKENGSAIMRPQTLRSDSTVTIVDKLSPTPSTPSPNSPKHPPHPRSSLKRNISYGNIPAPDRTEARVLVIFTGGTIGMVRNDKNALQPIPNAMVKNLRRYPHMHDEPYSLNRFGPAAGMGPLVLPFVEGQRRRIIYTLTEYDPLLDSSNMTIKEWVQIAEDIKQSYEFFDGFVILHGTDTLSYTASALSFMLENLGKSVIITGSQIPIFETRTDGKDNFSAALILAGNYVIPEVCVFFNNKLFRGNRTIKVSSAALDAFNSPNVPSLAQFGINVEVDYRSIFRPCSVSKFTVHTKMDQNVGILWIFPCITLATIEAFLKPPMRGVVLQSYGAGNMPTNREDILVALKNATSTREMIIVNCTQCMTGAVSDIYETGRLLKDCGVISGYDMTPEAALSKLAYVLSKDDWSMEMKRNMMECSLRGEMSSTKALYMQDFDLVDAVARSLHLSTPDELAQLGATLFPAMVNTAVQKGDVQKLELLKSYGADLSAINYDHRTALHVAATEGNLEVVRYLLHSGAAVHMRDRYDRSPLMEAISNDHHDVIKILIKCGAHITGTARGIGEHLCAAASRGLMTRLESYRLAGADLSQPDPSGRTALHLACLRGEMEMVAYLIKNYVDPNESDMLGLTPTDYAKRGGFDEIVEFLRKRIGTEADEE